LVSVIIIAFCGSVYFFNGNVNAVTIL